MTTTTLYFSYRAAQSNPHWRGADDLKRTGTAKALNPARHEGDREPQRAQRQSSPRHTTTRRRARDDLDSPGWQARKQRAAQHRSVDDTRRAQRQQNDDSDAAVGRRGERVDVPRPASRAERRGTANNKFVCTIKARALMRLQ